MTAAGDLPYRSGVGVVLFNARGHVFVGRRIDQSSEAWQLPQGGIDAGEKPKAAARRELKEEIGTDKVEFIGEVGDWISYDLPPDLVSQVWKGRYRGQRQKWFAARLIGADIDIDIATPQPEFDAWRWMPIDQLSALIVPFKRDLYRRVVEEFRHLAVPV